MKKYLLILAILCLPISGFAQIWSTSQTWNNEDKSKLYGRLIQNSFDGKIPEFNFSIMNSNDFTLRMLLMVEYIEGTGNIKHEIVYGFFLPGRRYSFEISIEEAFKKAGDYTNSLNEFLDTHVIYANNNIEWNWFPQKESKYFGYPFQNLFYMQSLENDEEIVVQKIGWWRIGGASRKGKFELPPNTSFLSFYIIEEIP